MSRRMSCSMTVDAVRNRTKTGCHTPGVGLKVARLYRDTLDLQGVVRDGYYVDDPLEPVRPGTPDPVPGGKVRRL